MSIQVVSQDSPPETQAAQNMTDLAKGEVQETKSAEAEETADETADESDASEDEGDESKDESQENEEKPKRKNSFKKRIDKLRTRLSDKEKEAEYWREQALRGGKPREQETTQERPQRKPDETGRPKQDNFDTHEEWLEAVADWKVEQKLAKRDAEARESEFKTHRQKQVDSHIERTDSFKKDHDDFEDVISEVDDVPMSVAVEEVILASDNGPALMYELAKNRDEYERICKLPPLAAARELGKIEARLAKSQETPKEERKQTKAPKPISTVGAKGGSGVKKSIFDPNISQADYEKLRREQLKDRPSW